jgi:hypothetical protein
VTDGFIVGKANGRKVKLMGTFVDSPLVWAVAGPPTPKGHAPPGVAAALNPARLGRPCRFGISRLGSGSHTMAHYASSLHGISSSSSAQQPEFVVANNFAGLKAGVRDGSFDAFLWETFTTKPSIDAGEISLVSAYLL